MGGIGTSAWRRRRAWLAALVVGAALALSSPAAASLATPFAGSWSTFSGSGTLTLQITDATGGQAAVAALGGPSGGCTAPTAYYRGNYTSGDGDSGQVAACTTDPQGVQLGGWYGGGPNGRHGSFTISTTCADPNSFSGEYFEASDGSAGSYPGTRAGPPRPPCSTPPATVSNITGRGQAEFKLPGNVWMPLRPGTTLQPGTYVHTGFQTTLTLTVGPATLTLGPLTLFKVGEKPVTYMTYGQVSGVVTHREGGMSDFEVKTATTTTSVRGTIFSIRVARNGTTTVSVTRGAMLVRPTNRVLRPVLVRAGHRVTVTRHRISRPTAQARR